MVNEMIGAPSIEVRVLAVLMNVAIAAVLAQLLSFVYVRFGTALSNRRSFARNFVLLACTTTLIITIVKSSLALSLGLVGALSIVRFRAAIKEPEELAYLFLTIAIGLGMGADQVKATVPAFMLIVAIIVAIGLRNGQKSDQNLFLTVSCDAPHKSAMRDIVSILGENCTSLNLRRFDERTEAIEVSFQVEFADYTQMSKTTAELRSLDESMRVSFVDNLGII